MNADITITITDSAGGTTQTSVGTTAAPPPLALEDLGASGATDAPAPRDLGEHSGGGAGATASENQEPPAPLPLDQLSTVTSSPPKSPDAVGAATAEGCCGAPEPLPSEALAAAVATPLEDGED